MDRECADNEPPGPGRTPVAVGVAGVGFEVVDATGLVSVQQRRWLVERCRQALAVLGAGAGKGGEVRVRVVGDAEMAAAHLKYHDTPGTTDVLTFDLGGEAAGASGTGGGDGAGGGLDVDILVCLDEARREASARGLAVERELLLYVVHGVLHCLGHDDGEEAAAARMHAEEDRVLEAIGVGATYGVGRGAGGVE